MAKMVQAEKKIALLHRYPKDQIKETNAAFTYLLEKGVDVLTFKSFNRRSNFRKFWKSIFWIFYAPFLVMGKKYDVIYCDDSFPFYPALVKFVSPKSKVVIRLGDFHLMYYYSGIIYKFLHHFEKIAWKKVDLIIAISDVMAQKIMKDIKKPVAVAYDPVDLAAFTPPKFIKALQKSVMFHGVLTKNKNVDILIEAARKLPEIKFWIFGDGPDFKRVSKIAPANVHLYGWVPFREIKDFISHSKVGVALRSKNPGNDYVVTSPFIQYGAMGKPCLVTRRAVFEDMDYKWQFSNVDEMVEKIKILMDSPKEGEKLRDYIVKNHDAKKIAEDIWFLLSS